VQQGTLTLHLDAGRSFRVQGTVNSYPVSYVVDTGASNTVISQQVADAAGILGCTNVGYSSTANGVVAKCVATASEISFGMFRFKNQMVTVLPNMGVDALLGMDVLRRMKIQQQDGVMYISGQ
jgi:aspartyl protease family protein